MPTTSCGLPGRQGGEQIPALSRWHGRGQQGRGGRFRQQGLERAEVLLGEGLGRRHQGGLMTGLDRAQHRVDAEDGLAGSHLAHQQPLHRLGLAEVGVDLLDRAALIGVS